MTDRREISDRVYESHVRLASKAPALYTHEAVQMGSEHIFKILKEEKVGSPGQSAAYWPHCAETFFKSFEGDPLHLYRERTINDILRLKQTEEVRLPGFGPKILSLLALFYAELNCLSMPKDAFPVDMHVQRFAISTGILEANGDLLNEHAEAALRTLICRIIAEEGWSALELSHAIWFLGKYLCSGCYRNTAVKVLCPAYDVCEGCPSSKPYFRKGKWELDAPRFRKGGDLTLVLPKTELFP